MIKISAPFRGCKPNNLSQGFHEGHLANDWASSYGTFLVAPFNCKIANVRTPDKIDDSQDDLRNGCGIRLVSTEDPTISLSYWHTLPVFPVAKGDIVLQGGVVAQMGNTGWVETNGKLVEIDIRLIPPYPGTHTHISMGRQVGDVYTPLNMYEFIDFNIPIKYDVLNTIMAFLTRIGNILK